MDIKGIVFDLYGTLYDTGALERACDDAFPTFGAALAQQWRQTQREYTWLRSLVERFTDFDTLTEQALVHTCAAMALELDAGTRRRLCDAWLALPPYSDMGPTLRRLRDAGLPIGLLADGSQAGIGQLIGNSGMKWGFDKLVSVDEVRVFKPQRKVYLLAEQRMMLAREQLLYVSAHCWDASAASLIGFAACWINRDGQPVDELEAALALEVVDLKSMADWVLGGSVS